MSSKSCLHYFYATNSGEYYEATMQRFEREAKALAELGTHPNIPNLLKLVRKAWSVLLGDGVH